MGGEKMMRRATMTNYFWDEPVLLVRVTKMGVGERQRAVNRGSQGRAVRLLDHDEVRAGRGLVRRTFAPAARTSADFML
jgi:hypothetical protein